MIATQFGDKFETWLGHPGLAIAKILKSIVACPHKRSVEGVKILLAVSSANQPHQAIARRTDTIYPAKFLLTTPEMLKKRNIFCRG